MSPSLSLPPHKTPASIPSSHSFNAFNSPKPTHQTHTFTSQSATKKKTTKRATFKPLTTLRALYPQAIDVTGPITSIPAYATLEQTRSVSPVKARQKRLLLVPERSTETQTSHKFRKVQRNVHGVDMIVWQSPKGNAPLHFIKHTRSKLERFPRGYIEEIFPSRSDMHSDEAISEAFQNEGIVAERHNEPWFKSMRGRLMSWDLREIDGFIMRNHFSEKSQILEALRGICKKPIEILRAVFLLACKYEWDAYHVRDYLREMGLQKAWVCEGVLRGLNLPEDPSAEGLDEDAKQRRGTTPPTGESIRRHSWVVVQFSRGPRTSDGGAGVYYVMDATLARLCADPPEDDDTPLDTVTDALSSPDPAPHFNDFWFLVPPMMLRFTHIAARAQNRHALSGYEQLLPETLTMPPHQSPVEQYPQSLVEFQLGPAISINALYLGIFPRNTSARLSMQIISNYVKLEFDSVTHNKIDVSFRITSLDDNPFKEAYHIWESYPTTNQLLIHFIFRSRGIYKVEMHMRFEEDDMSVGEFPYLHLYTYVFHVKRGMKCEVGGFNANVFNNMNFHDTLHQVESPLQRLLQVNTVYTFRVLLNTQLFSGAAVMLTNNSPVQAVPLEQREKAYDVDSHLQLFEADVLLERRRRTVHLVGFLRSDPDKKYAVHISTWHVVNELRVVQDQENEKFVKIPDSLGELAFGEIDSTWVENALHRQGDTEAHNAYNFRDDTLPPPSIEEIPQIVIQPNTSPEPDIIIVETQQQRKERLAAEKRRRWLTMTLSGEQDNSDAHSESTVSPLGEVNVSISEKLNLLMPSGASASDLPQLTPVHSARRPKLDALNQTMTSLRRLSVGKSETIVISPTLSPIEPSETEKKIDEGQKLFSQHVFDEAIKLWKEVIAVEPNNDEVLYDLAVACEEVGNMQEAQQYYVRAANLGHVEAMMSAASAASEAEDHVTACKYLQMASNENRIEAMYALGVHYSTGQGIEQDAVKAFSLFKHAADSGHLLAKYNVGHYYCRGIKGHLDVDFEKARSYFYEASEMDHLPSITSLGWLHEHGKLNVEQNMQRALEYYHRAASMGEPTAWYNIGMIYLKGCPEVPRDEIKGMEYLERASVMGDDSAAETLQHMKLRLQYEEELETITQIYRGEVEFGDEEE